MATSDEKRKALIKLLGREMAEAVFKQADLTEKQADEMNLKYKELRRASAPFASPPAYNPPGATGIGAILRSK